MITSRDYDSLLGGKDNHAADRAAMDAVLKINPDAAFAARANRAFLGRAVRYLAAEAGIRQFLDIGTGIPAAGSTHEIAQETALETRVVYVDYDPVVLAHARALLTSTETGAASYIDADLRDTPAILAQARHLLDFTRPVAVTLLAILHAVPDADDPHAIVAQIMDAVPSGSYLAISHGGADLLGREKLDGVMDIASQAMRQQFTPRTREQVARFFEGTDLAEPGLVHLEEWRPGPAAGEAGESSTWCAVGRKRLPATRRARWPHPRPAQLAATAGQRRPRTHFKEPHPNEYGRPRSSPAASSESAGLVRLSLAHHPRLVNRRSARVGDTWRCPIGTHRTGRSVNEPAALRERFTDRARTGLPA